MRNMFRKIGLGAIFCLLNVLAFSQGIFSKSLVDIDGNNVALNSFAGKKVLVIIAPVKNPKLAHQIDSFASVYASKVKVIAIPSYNDGYVDSNKVNIKQLYTSAQLLLTEPMYTHKGLNQSTFFSWIEGLKTSISNHLEIVGEGQMFFFNERGHLNAILYPPVPIFSVFVENKIQ